MNRKRSKPKIDRKMPMVHPNAAAIDVGATMHMAAVRPDRTPEPVRSDARIEAVLKDLSIGRGRRSGTELPSPRRSRTDQANALAFDVRAALFALLGKDITKIDGLGPYLSLKLIAECGDDLSAWPSPKHFTSWLCLAPSNKISGGKVLSSRTRRSGSRAAALLRLAAVTVGRTDTAYAHGR